MDAELMFFFFRPVSLWQRTSVDGLWTKLLVPAEGIQPMPVQHPVRWWHRLLSGSPLSTNGLCHACTHHATKYVTCCYS